MSNHPDRKMESGGNVEKNLSQSSQDRDDNGSQAHAHLTLNPSNSLARLRDKVEEAAHELIRLRDENSRLSRRLQNLESKYSVQPGETQITLDETTDSFQHRVKSFIRSIDKYLDNDDQDPASSEP